MEDERSEEQAEQPYKLVTEYEVQYQLATQDPDVDDWYVSAMYKSPQRAFAQFASDKKYNPQERHRIVQLVTRTHVVDTYEPAPVYAGNPVKRDVPYRMDVTVGCERHTAASVLEVKVETRWMSLYDLVKSGRTPMYGAKLRVPPSNDFSFRNYTLLAVFDDRFHVPYARCMTSTGFICDIECKHLEAQVVVKK